MKKLKTLILAAGLAASLAVAPISKAEDVDLSTPNYKPLSGMIGQAFRSYPTPQGEMSCVVLPYDRNEDGKIDLVEVRVMKPDQGIWEDKPYMVATDDDFDGIADRVLIDIERDGKFDTGQNVKSKKTPIEKYY